MPDENVEKWKQKGRLYLWHYLEHTRNYPGWHLTADDACCRSLVDLIERMSAARWSSQKSLVVTPPSKEVLSIPNNIGGEARCKSAGKFILKHPKGIVDDEYFSLEENGSTVVLSAGGRKLELLKECVLKIPTGEGDYSIKVGDRHLWFWWMLK
ncbi:MAG TPA: hypothetical protein VGX92_17455 [Pyrinomonadaceae bacterium]|jgi:hypothetical protein|nr:hypothetical protein [Pyrinomonadaceae bacterium]